MPREQASWDIDDAIAWSLGEGATEAALNLIDALEQAFSYIGRHPARLPEHIRSERESHLGAVSKRRATKQTAGPTTRARSARLGGFT